MSGVRTGSRLQQLLALRARIDHEIEIEQARQTQRNAGRWTPFTRAGHATPNRVDQLLTTLGVTHAEVKVWALDTGHIAEIKRGRVSLALAELYADHHQNGART